MILPKKANRDTVTAFTGIVLPNDANPLGILQGGKLLHWMDITSVIAAQKYCEKIVVTAAIEKVKFIHPVKIGEVVNIQARVTQIFNTSLEVYAEAWAENILAKTKYKCSEAKLTFVALNSKGKPAKISRHKTK